MPCLRDRPLGASGGLTALRTSSSRCVTPRPATLLPLLILHEDKSLTTQPVTLVLPMMAEKGQTCALANSTPKKRKEKFSDHELRVLVDEVMVNAEKLFGRNACNPLGRSAIWEQIVWTVNREGGMCRAVTDCKKRWNDYKSKIAKTLIKIKKLSELGKLHSKEDVLSSRQLRVAIYFHMDLENKNEVQQICDDLSYDGDLWPTPLHEQSSFSHADSEDDFVLIPRKESSTISQSSTGNNSQDQSVSQSNEVEIPTDQDTPNAHGSSLEATLLVTPVSPQNVDAKLDKLITLQEQNNEILQAVQSSTSMTLKLQKKMNHLVKNNFKQIQKSILLGQKMSKERENFLELRLKSLQTALDDLKDSLLEKTQNTSTSDDTDEEASLAPSATSTTAFKRGHIKLETSHSSLGSPKTKKMKRKIRDTDDLKK
ncbi:uncharacterized protein RCH25_007920 [Pelodytes ibericus]